MVGLAKLIGWLIDSGVLEWMAQGVDDLVGLFQGAWNTLKDIAGLFAGIGEAIWGALPEPIRKGLEAMGKVASDVLGPLGDLAKRAGGVVAAGAGLLVGGQLLAGMLNMGSIGPLAVAGKGVARLFGGGGGGGGAGAGGLSNLGMFGGGGGGGAGWMARMGLRGGTGPFGMNRLVAGAGAGVGAYALNAAAGGRNDLMGSVARVGSAAGYGAMMGSPFGPWGMGIGAGVGGGVGLAAELGVPGADKLTGMFGINKPGGGGGGDTNVTGDIKNIGTQNITMNVYVQDKEMAREIIKNVDEQATASAEAGG